MLRGEREVQERRSDNDDHAWEYKDMCGSDCRDLGRGPEKTGAGTGQDANKSKRQADVLMVKPVLHKAYW